MARSNTLKRFLIVGIINTVIDFGLYNALVRVIHPNSPMVLGLLSIFATITATINSFILNRRWTFGSSDSIRKQELKFVFSSTVSLIINYCSVILGVKLLSQSAGMHYLSYNLPKILAAFLATAWNYLSYRFWVFTSVPEDLKLEPTEEPSQNLKLISIIIPAYNEEKRLPSRLGDIFEHFDSDSDFDYEIIIVNDGSKDSTQRVIDYYASCYPNLRSIKHERNFGKGWAVRSGILASKGHLLVFTDADTTFSTDHIRRILAELRNGTDFAAGIRRDRRWASHGESKLRLLMGLCFNRLARLAAGLDIPDTQCGLKGFRRRAALDIAKRQRTKGFAFDVELFALSRGLGYQTTTIDLSNYIDCSDSTVKLIEPLKMAVDLIKLKYRLFINSYSMPDYSIPTGAKYCAIFVFALAARLPEIFHIPNYIDELKEVNLAYQIYSGQTLPLHNVAWDIGAMHNYILAFIFKVFGPSIYLPRLYTVTTSALSICVIYRLAFILYGEWTALIAAGFFITNGMYILVSHMAWANSTTPLFFSLAALYLVKSEKQKSGIYLCISAFLWSLALQTHSSIMIYIIGAVAYIATSGFIRKIRLSPKWYLIAVGVSVIGYLNMIIYNINSHFGSLLWLTTQKPYAYQNSPSFSTFYHNTISFLNELFRTTGSIYGEHSTQSYLVHPTFVLTAFLSIYGIYKSLRNKESLLPIMIVTGLLITPIFNYRYAFYLATRYIMPVVICTGVLIAYSISLLIQRAFDNVKSVRSLRFASRAIAYSLLFGLTCQMIPLVMHYTKASNTIDSNDTSLDIVASIKNYSNYAGAVILLDKHLPIPNSPLECLLKLNNPEQKIGFFDDSNQLSKVKGRKIVLYSKSTYNHLMRDDEISPLTNSMATFVVQKDKYQLIKQKEQLSVREPPLRSKTINY